MAKKTEKAPNANWKAGLKFVLGNLGTLMEYIRRDVKEKKLEAKEADHFLSGPYIGWLKDAQTKLKEGRLKDLRSAFLDVDRVTRAVVRLCQLEYCTGKELPLRAIHYWDFEEYKWLEEALPDYHPVHRELNELLVSLRLSLGDPALDGLLALVDKAEKETFRFSASREESEEIEGLESELSGKLDESLQDEEDFPLIEFVEVLLSDAVERKVTEIEIVPGPWRGLVQYRFGDAEEFKPQFELPPPVTKAVVIRLKILAGLDIANIGEAQDGQIGNVKSPALTDRKISLATTPTPHREKALIRLE